MPLLNGYTAPNTPVDPVTQAYTRINQNMEDILNIAISKREASFRQFWANPIALAAKYGTNCAELFNKDAATVAFLVQMTTDPVTKVSSYTPSMPDTTKWQWVYNGDGSVTITAVPPAPKS